MSTLRYALGVGVFGLLIWQALVWITGVPHFILPSPWRVTQAAWDNRMLIAENAVVTATEVGLGLLIGTILGAVTAIQLAASQRMHRLVMPLLVFTQAVPVFALAPILTLWFGYGIASKVTMAVLIIYFPVTSAYYDGLTQVPRDILDMARTMDSTKWQVMRRIRIPHALPSLGTGLKLAAVYAPIGAVIGEWVGASKGLGYLMLLANGRAKTDLMFASLITLALMTIALYAAVSKASSAFSRA
ncbi:ABC transporter permease [Sedimentitalea nanhaiensis]|uniref:Putative hydroxymethylpyrimidine transport system permease protein n=1 Tax=Sedimentitalea nanhaiensis TaxID=999627 RepID=A0A1I7BTU9_9RHOB|nr:ABC transporter permease [Sedimentitalea nanhaiensis]SFT90616.1 putative hydroxymethylpyrimidine transport system permease protein [Sedimentitalea nanhaiensis]